MSTHVLNLAKLDLQKQGAAGVGRELGLQETWVVRVEVARPVKTRMVRLRFAKTSIWVLAFANPRVGGWVGLQK